MTTRDSLIITVLVFNLLFPTVGYALTSLSDTGAEFTSTVIDPDLLVLAGLDVANATTHAVEWKGGYVVFEQSGSRYRVKWDENYLGKWDGFTLQSQTNPIDRALNTWFFASNVLFTNATTGSTMPLIENSTLLSEYNEEYLWSKFRVAGSSLVLLFTANQTITANFTEAVTDYGSVLVTICELEDDGISLTGFIDFFTGTLIGDNMFGLPAIFAWIMRLITGLSVLALAWFIKDMTQI